MRCIPAIEVLCERGADLTKIPRDVYDNLPTQIIKHLRDMRLHIACRKGDLQAVTTLLSQGLRTNLRDKEGNTPLHIAAKYGQASVVQHLLSLGKKNIDVENDFNETPLYLACHAEQTSIIPMLMNNGASVHRIKDLQNSRDVYFLVKSYLNSKPALPLQHQNPSALPAGSLSLMCQIGDPDFVALAIKKGAIADRKTLTWACLSKDIQIANQVIALGAVPDDETLAAACSTNIPLMVHKAIEAGAKNTASTKEVLRKFKEIKPEIVRMVSRMQPSESSTPQPIKRPVVLPANALTLACMTRDIDIINLALSKGAKPDNETLTWACLTNSLLVFDAVRDKGAQPDQETLTAACSMNSIAMVLKALNAGATPSLKTYETANRVPNFNLEILKLIESKFPKRKDGQEKSKWNELTKACARGDFQQARQAVLQGNGPQKYTLLKATESGDANIFRIAYSVGSLPHRDPLQESEVDAALSSDSEDFVKYVFPLLLTAGIIPTAKTLDLAIKHATKTKSYNNLFLIADLIELGAKPSSSTFTLACELCKILQKSYPELIRPILKRLLSIGAKPDANTLKVLPMKHIDRDLYNVLVGFGLSLSEADIRTAPQDQRKENSKKEVYVYGLPKDEFSDLTKQEQQQYETYNIVLKQAKLLLKSWKK